MACNKPAHQDLYCLTDISIYNNGLRLKSPLQKLRGERVKGYIVIFMNRKKLTEKTKQNKKQETKT